MDIALYEKCSRDNAEKTRKLEIEREVAAQKWKLIAENAAACGIDVDSHV